MADKYLIHGATYCGDGTTSAEAASNGAAGAWNNINVIEGSAPAYGSLAAGDVVHIRSKTSAGADITRVQAASITLGSASGTLENPITWVLDHGSVWSGISGTLTYEVSSGNYSVAISAFNTIHTSVDDRIVFKISQANYYAYYMTISQGAVLSNVWFNLNSVTLTSGGPGVIKALGQNLGFSHLINPKVTLGTKMYEYLFYAYQYSTLHITSPRITLDAATYTDPLFKKGGYGSVIKVFGGSISGSTSGKVLAYMVDPDGDLQFHGTLIPANMVYYSPFPTGVRGDQRIEGFGVDGGVGAFSVRVGGIIDSRQDGYYPTLNGTYPNSSNQGYSWKITPTNTAKSHPLDIESSILYTADASVKTVTVEMLVADAFESAGKITKDNIWLDVLYVDHASGLTKSVSSVAFGSTTTIDTSSAGWSTTTYGATNLLKRKISLTTPTSIKKDSLITTLLRWVPKAVSVTDIAFVDPEPQLT